MHKRVLIQYDKIKSLIDEGLSTAEISKQVHLSTPTIIKLVRFHGESAVVEKLNKTNNRSRAKGFLAVVGHARGRTYEQLYGDKADEMRKKRSDWLKANNIRKFATRISKPQALLFSIVKEHFSQAEIEYEIKLGLRKSIWLDIAMPDLKINIEYDGMYWHKLNKTTIRISDIKRDEFLKNAGWTVFRIQSEQNLTETQLRLEFNKLDLVKV